MAALCIILHNYMRGIIDALYWRLHTTFLLNDREKAQRFLEMLEDEAKKSPCGVASELSPPHVMRFAQIRGSMARGQFGRLHGDGYSAPSEDFPAEPSGPEKDFHLKLMSRECRPLLMAVLGAGERSGMVHEADLSPYGICDFVVRDQRVRIALEVKMGESPTSVVSQIDRYRLALELDMNLGAHDEVRAVVMAESFPTYVAGELSRLGVEMVRHDGTGQGFTPLVPK